MELTGKRILIVDDEPRLQQVLSIALEKHGVVPYRANHGEEAFEIAATRNPDLIIMDLYMPVMDGFDAIRGLRMIMHDKPILVLSGHLDEQNIAKAIEAGATACLPKPYKLNELFDKIKEVLTEQF